MQVRFDQAAPRRTLPADVTRRPTPADWPFAAQAPLTARQLDDARNTVALAAGRHLNRRFTGAAITDFGALV